MVMDILHTWIPRDVEPRLQRAARTRPVVVLTGARQTGKTSTFRRLFPAYEFVSLDLPSEAEQAEKEPGSFLRQHRAPVIIDEGTVRAWVISLSKNRSRCWP
jgi:predicted AAA+ superfamily ATPase